MPTPSFTPHEAQFLRDAADYLENPSFLMRLANLVGKPLEELARFVPARVAQAGEAAIRHAMRLAVRTLPAAASVQEKGLQDAYASAGWTGFWHQLATTATGLAGGLFGLPGLTLELPTTTGIMFRSIASIARDFGEAVEDPAVRLECLAVFGQGGPGPGDDALESSYLTARLATARLIQDALAFLARESAQAVAEAIARGTAPTLVKFIGRVAACFNTVVSQKFLAQSIPLLGGLTGALINTAFSDHFNTVARYHFGIRKLERRWGLEAMQAAYRSERAQAKGAGRHATSAGADVPMAGTAPGVCRPHGTAGGPPTGGGDASFLVKAWRLAEAAEAAYLGPHGAIAERLGAPRAATFSRRGTFGYAAEVGPDVVVAFRGTVPGELLNWLTTLDFAQAPFPPGLGHKGITEALESVWEQVRGRAMALLTPGRTAWFTGHSLGGALATLAAARFARHWDDVRVCTFGAPRVGCPDFAAGYKPTLHRLERVTDLVCHLPPPPGMWASMAFALNNVLPAPVAWRLPEDARYAHAGALTLLHEDGSISSGEGDAEAFDTLDRRLLPILGNVLRPACLLEGHQIEGYIACLKAAATGEPARTGASHPGGPTSGSTSMRRSRAHIGIEVTVVNRTDRKLLRRDAAQCWGVYAPSPPGAIDAGASGRFRIESNGLMTGADGCVTYQIQGHDGVVRLVFQTPFWHSNYFEGSAPDGFVVDWDGQLTGRHPSVSFTIRPA